MIIFIIITLSSSIISSNSIIITIINIIFLHAKTRIPGGEISIFTAVIH